MRLPVDRIARKIVPSTVLLSNNGALMTVCDALDKPITAAVKDYRGLPPNRFRIRIGSGNRVLLNQRRFLDYGRFTMNYMADHGFLSWDSRIVDVGCGCGRLAIALKRTEMFRGTYVGIDVDSEMVAWCTSNLGDDRFAFEHADLHNALYNPDGTKQKYRLTQGDGSVDLVCSMSVFTHLLEEPIREYLAESHRVLAPGQTMAMTVFCLEHVQAKPQYMDRWSFQHALGSAFVENLDYPEAAVAYREVDLVHAVRDAGFSAADVLEGGDQSWLVGKK